VNKEALPPIMLGEILFPPFLKEAYEKLEELYKFYLKTAIDRLADDLKISSELLQKIIEKKEAITPGIARRLRYLYAIKLGKIKIKVPKPLLVPPIEVPPPPKVEIKKCTTFTRLSGLEDKNTIYEAENIRDVLPNFVEYKDYDHAMDPIGTWLEEWSVTFFRKKDKAMRLVKAAELSMSTHYQNECPESRRFEYELIDIETGKPRYGFIYTKGKIIWSLGHLPLPDIIFVLKKIGAWEK